MLGDNLKTLRKQKGFSQETLAQQLNVVRQTVSKWEKGLSVPDAEMLERLAEQFEVSVDSLLSNNAPVQESATEMSEVAKQLAILNEQLANRSRNRRRTLKRVLIGIVGVFLALVVFYVGLMVAFSYHDTPQTLTTTSLTCTLGEETYYYEITYDEQYQIVSGGGDAWIADHVMVEQYNDANVLIAQIEDYFLLRGGTCEIE